MADAERTLRNLLDKITVEHKCEDYNVTPISCGGPNYTSHLFVATINDRNGPDLNLFAKVAALGERIRSQVDCKIYSDEQLFYSKIAKVYQQIQDEHNVPDEHRFQIPKLYGYNPTVLQETIVLENLTMQGFKTHDRFKSVKWEYAAAAVGELAKLHALSIAYQHERPEEFETLLDQFEPKWSVGKSAKEVFVYAGLQLSKAVVREENADKFIKFFDSINREALMNYFEPLRRVVITHGDFKTCNIMYRLDEDGKIQMIPVDYQLLKGGCPVTDLLHFIFTSTDEQFRAQHYQRLLDHYHAQLSLALRRLHLDPDEKYSREDFEYELKEKLPIGLILAVAVLPLSTVEADNAPKLAQDMDITGFSVQKTNELFSKRINGVVNDFVKWGVLF